MTAGRRRHGSGVLHDPGSSSRSRIGRRWNRDAARREQGPRGASLIEALISLSILTIGVLSVVGLLASGRRSAERAAGTAAAALAAQQVLEATVVEGLPDPMLTREVQVGVHRVRVTLTVEPVAGAPVRMLRAHALDLGSGRDWNVETFRAGS